MLPTLVFLIEFFALCWAFSGAAGLSLTVSPAVVCAIAVLFLYLADFAGLMYPAALALHGAGLVAGGYWLLSCFKKSTVASTPARMMVHAAGGVAIVVFILVALYLKNAQGAYREWDEFSHWGTIIKAISLSNTFHFEVSPLAFQDYPPGSALFVYFVLTFIGYSEGHAMFAYSLLTCAFLLPLLGKAHKDGWLASIAIGLLAGYAVLEFGSGWTSVLIESHLSVVAAGALLVYFCTQDNRGCWLWTGLVLCLLVLIKDAGRSLALLTGLIVIADRLQRVLFSSGHAFAVPRRTEVVRVFALMTVGALVLPTLTHWSWKWHVAASNLHVGMNAASFRQLLDRVASCCTTERELAVIKKFIEWHFGVANVQVVEGSIAKTILSIVPQLDWSLAVTSLQHIPKGFLTLDIFLVALLLMLFLGGKAERVRCITLHAALTAGAVAYSGSILLYYLYAFSDYEASVLISYHRYHDVYFLMWGLVLLYSFADVLAKVEGRHRIALRAMVSLLALGCIPFDGSSDRMRELLSVKPIREPSTRTAIKSWLRDVEVHIPSSARVYVMWAGSKGLEFFMTRQELLPRVTNLGCFSFGKPQFEGDIWSCEISGEKLRHEFAGYDYLIVGKGLQALQAYGQLPVDGLPAGRDSALIRVLGARQSGAKAADDVQARFVYVETSGFRHSR